MTYKKPKEIVMILYGKREENPRRVKRISEEFSVGNHRKPEEILMIFYGKPQEIIEIFYRSFIIRISIFKGGNRVSRGTQNFRAPICSELPFDAYQ